MFLWDARAASVVVLLAACAAPPAAPPAPVPAVPAVPAPEVAASASAVATVAPSPPATALPAAPGSPAAAYLVAMHQRIHPRVTEGAPGAMDSEASEALEAVDLRAVVEVVLAGDTGVVLRAALLRASGSTIVDAAAVRAVISGGPYGAAPERLRSRDGKVYVEWELRPTAADVCAPRNARVMAR